MHTNAIFTFASVVVVVVCGLFVMVVVVVVVAADGVALSLLLARVMYTLCFINDSSLSFPRRKTNTQLTLSVHKAHSVTCTLPLRYVSSVWFVLGFVVVWFVYANGWVCVYAWGRPCHSRNVVE